MLSKCKIDLEKIFKSSNKESNYRKKYCKDKTGKSKFNSSVSSNSPTKIMDDRKDYEDVLFGFVWLSLK